MPFKIGNSVKVKQDVMCPDDDSICIAGWRGRVFETDGDMIGVHWDSITLKQLPHEYIRHSEQEGLDWTSMYLLAEELEAASPRDSEKAANQVRAEMESKSVWLATGNEGRRILQVIGKAADETKAWHNHLAQILTFPFDAEVSEAQDRGPLDCGDSVKVTGLVETDDLYGILVNVTLGRKRYVFPLCDLTVRDKNSPNYLPVRDYCVWFANR